VPGPGALNSVAILQLALAARLAPQLLDVMEKFAALFPVMLTLFIVNAAFPVFVSVAIKDLLPLPFTVPKFSSAGTICTVPFVSVMAAPAVFAASVTDAAFTLTCGLAGTLDGGMYVVGVPVAVVVGATVPQPEVHAVEPWTMVQLACEGVAGSFTTVAVNCCNPLFTGINADPGDTWIVIASTVTVAEPVFVASLAAAAVIVTWASFSGGVDGAVYVTELFVAPLSVP
jgi:hypothetical protein